MTYPKFWNLLQIKWVENHLAITEPGSIVWSTYGSTELSVG